MLECWRIRLLWSLSEICKSVIEIFWDEVFMHRNTMKTGEPFLAGSLLQAFRLWGLRKEMWAEKKKQRGWGVGVEARELDVPSSPPLPLFLLIVFLALLLRAAPHYPNAWNRLQFLSGRFSSTSTSGNASFWLVLILSDQCQLTCAEDLLYWSTVQKTGRRLSAWSKRNQGATKKTSASELTANFHSIF